MRDLHTRMFTILTSNKCTAACGHCAVSSSPDRTGKLNLDTIIKAIDELNAFRKLEVVVFAGGEPTLLRDDLFEAISFCDAKGIVTRVVTNASWAVTDHAARKMIKRFREAGLAELNLSADDYHLPYISFDNIKRAWKASKNQGFVNVAIANCAGSNSQITPEYIKRELNEPNIDVRFDDQGSQSSVFNVSDDGSTYMLSNALLQRIGRARDEVHEKDLSYPAAQSMLDVGCQWALASAALSPKGHLVACCGIEASGNEVLDYGDIRIRNTSEIAMDASKQLLTRAISVIGPYRLLHLAKSLDRSDSVKLRERYSSVCEACEDLVNQPHAIAALKNHKKLIEHELDAKSRARQ